MRVGILPARHPALAPLLPLGIGEAEAVGTFQHRDLVLARAGAGCPCRRIVRARGCAPARRPRRLLDRVLDEVGAAADGYGGSTTTKIKLLLVAVESKLGVFSRRRTTRCKPLDVAAQRIEAARQHVVPGDETGAAVAAPREQPQARTAAASVKATTARATTSSTSVMPACRRRRIVCRLVIVLRPSAPFAARSGDSCGQDTARRADRASMGWQLSRRRCGSSMGTMDSVHANLS